jgi:hypothetical protein
MKHWHPESPDGDGSTPGHARGRHREMPPGWWIFPGIFFGFFLWAGIFVLLVSGLSWLVN